MIGRMVLVSGQEHQGKILVVDDDPLTQTVIRGMLEHESFTVVEAAGGEMALTLFREQPFDLVLLDVLMPEMDGFTTCARLRETPAGRMAPIVMITGLDDESSIRSAYGAGATDFITKPLNAFILVHRVRYILRATAAMRELAWRVDFQRVLIETLPVPFIVEDTKGHCLMANPAFATLQGEDAAGVADEPHAESRSRVPQPSSVDGTSIGAEGQRIYEAEILLAGKEPRSMIIHQAMFTPPVTGETGVISVLIDITERKKNEENRRLAETVFQNAADAIMVTSATGIIKSINPAFSTITGYGREEVMGLTPRLLRSGRQDNQFYAAFWASLRQYGKWSGELWQRRKNGEVYPVWETVAAVRSPEGRIIEYVSFFNDITARKQAEQEIFYRANYDPLTGLPNRSLFHERLEQALKQARRYDRRVALMFADLDRFKQVNDTLGHSFGDQLLGQAALRLEACVRDTDTVARQGGDEFVVVLPNVIEERDAGVVAEKIISRLREPFDLSGNIVHIGVSIGIALYPDHGDNSEDLVRHADLAMYQAKLAGRNTYRLYESAMADELNRQLMLETDLRTALQKNELELYFQPILKVEDKSLVRAEALLRWFHPRRGPVAPGEFIPLAEETGLIRDIGLWVFERACQTLEKWHELGLMIPLAINLTSAQVFRGLSLEVVSSLLERYHLAPESLVFEIAEGVLLADSAQARQWLKSIRQLGICLDLDDFGTGYSSLSCLKRFPIDRVKIDLSFVRDMVLDLDDRALVEAILALSRSLRLEVVAEGVETQEQFDLLRALGCGYAQGYYFSHPVSADAFVEVARALAAR